MSVGGWAVRERLRRLVEHRRFQRTVLGVIIANAVILGLETSIVTGPADQVLQVLDDLAEHEERSDAEVMDELRAIRAQLATLQTQLAASRTGNAEPEAEAPTATVPAAVP